MRGHRENAVRVGRYDEIYVLAPSRSVSGGPEALHQLVDALRRRGHRAFICYVPKPASPVPPEFGGYDVVVGRPRDRSGNLIVIPEIWTGRLRAIRSAEVAVWWLSVDNFFGDRPDDDLQFAEMIRRHDESVRARIPTRQATWQELSKVRNFHQSRYAAEFLQSRGISSQRLGDYINGAFGRTDLAGPRRDALAYNPVKGLPRIERLMQAFPQWEWIPIRGMPRRDVARLLNEVKVYVDFGAHPGRDRIPREAVLAGACVVTGVRGSAGAPGDVMIPGGYRLDENAPDFTRRFGELVASIFSRFDVHAAEFDTYREEPVSERSVFAREVVELFE